MIMVYLELLANFLHFFWLFMHASGHSCTHIYTYTQSSTVKKQKLHPASSHEITLKAKLFYSFSSAINEALTKDWRVWGSVHVLRKLKLKATLSHISLNLCIFRSHTSPFFIPGQGEGWDWQYGGKERWGNCHSPSMMSWAASKKCPWHSFSRYQ